MEMSYGTVELQPPWAGELLARNRKVARNIWSTSDLSPDEILQIEKVVGVSPSWTSTTESPNNSSREDSKDSSSINQSPNHGGYGGGEQGLRSIDPVVGGGGGGGSASRASGSGSGSGGTPLLPQTDTSSSSMTSNNNVTKGSKNKYLKGQRSSSSSSDFEYSSEYYDCKSSFDDTTTAEQEESILEYGPGIVRKLRSKYQSLAVRQSSTRPSLWRSASLENCLELDQQPQLQQEQEKQDRQEQQLRVRSQSPTPSPPVRQQGKIYTKNMTQNIVESSNEQPTKPRGRTAATKAEKVAKNNANAAATNMKSDREHLRRARSVDALHNIMNEGIVPRSSQTKRRMNQHEIDEDILEKCKTVVTPKEEIVIIEMSKPNHISATGAALLRLSSSDKGKLQLFNGNNGYYYRNSSTTKNYFNAANGRVNSTSFDSTGLVRGDSITSPEHELPPHDIVRETARLFEIHNNHSAAGFNSNWRKVVGQALRLTNGSNVNGKSSAEEINSTTESRETTPAPPSPSPVITTAVSVTSTPAPMLKAEKDKEITKGSSTNYSNSATQVPTTYTTPPSTLLPKNTVNGKQIGVIRPTVNGFKLEDNASSKTSPGLSPIIMNPSLSKGKPPLSPKPVNLFYTSSPKTLLSNTNANANANTNTTNTTARDSENNNANEKTETTTKPPKPGPRTLLNVNKNKSSEPLTNVAMQNSNDGIVSNSNSKASSGLHPTNQNGNDVIRMSSPDKHIGTLQKNEEHESKSLFTSVSLKPVPLVLSTSSLSSSSPVGSAAGSLGAYKGSQINANCDKDKESLQEKDSLKENRNTINNASKRSNSPSLATGTSSPSNTMLTDSVTHHGGPSSPRPSRSSPTPTPTDEPLPFQQAKWKLKKQQNVNSNSNAREEILNSNNNNATAASVSSSNPIRSDKNANLDTISQSQTKHSATTTIEFKPKVKETEVDKQKIGTSSHAQVNKEKEQVAPPLPSSPMPSTTTTSITSPIPRAKLTESLQSKPPPSQPQPQPPAQSENKPKKTVSRGNDNDGVMVFNFTKTRSKVPDYIEDDGSGVNVDDVDSSSDLDRIDPKLIHFVGANVIINGRSSIQKKPKSKKLNISFNEAATTFEYPSETSILNEENDSESNNNTAAPVNHSTSGILGQKTPNGIHGSVGGLGSYTPSKASPGLYQLGAYKEKSVDASDDKKTAVNPSVAPADDYLRPDTETTTWSNEIGAADILF